MEIDLKNYEERDPFILFSLVNTKLRDFYSSLEDFCYDFSINKDSFLDYMLKNNFIYDGITNQFKIL